MQDNINDLILIVDDNPHNIQVMAAVVNQCGYKSGFAMDGRQALDFLEENIPALILLDVMMPDMNGYEVCQEIKKNKDLQDIPIIFLTARTEKEDIIKGFEVGGVDYVTKPFNNSELKMRIRNHIELQQSKNKLSELNQKLEESNATKDKFFSLIAHDLRGPIGNINQYMNFLIEDVEEIGNQSLTEDFKALKTLAKTSYELLENLLIWASSQKGAIDYNPTIDNLHKLVQSNIELFKSSAEKKQIHLKNELDPEMKSLFDYNMINTVVRNLLNNAIKYTNENGEITISVSNNPEYTELSVNDNGVGIDPSSVDSLFQIDVKKFSKEGTSGEMGSGLGLILCKEFIDKHNGKIWAESEIGKGSSFKFTIPK